MLEEAEKKGEDLAILQRSQNQHELKMVEMRWCPITHGGAPFWKEVCRHTLENIKKYGGDKR